MSNDAFALGGTSRAAQTLDVCHSPEDATIAQAVQQLIAEIKRHLGDSQSAVDLARRALAAAKGEPEIVAFMKCALGHALNDNGQTEEALKQAQEAWTLVQDAELPTRAASDVLSQIINYASQLGAHETLKDAVATLDKLPDDSEEVKSDKKRAAARGFANWQLRGRLVEVLRVNEPAKRAGTETCASLCEANALVVRPLLRLWDDLREAKLDCASGSYDFWGRGNFERSPASEVAFLRDRGRPS